MEAVALFFFLIDNALVPSKGAQFSDRTSVAGDWKLPPCWDHVSSPGCWDRTPLWAPWLPDNTFRNSRKPCSYFPESKYLSTETVHGIQRYVNIRGAPFSRPIIHCCPNSEQCVVLRQHRQQKKMLKVEKWWGAGPHCPFLPALTCHRPLSSLMLCPLPGSFPLGFYSVASFSLLSCLIGMFTKVICFPQWAGVSETDQSLDSRTVTV